MIVTNNNAIFAIIVYRIDSLFRITINSFARKK